MNNNPIFSVIVPTYNREFLLKRAIDSILDQSLKNFELFIVDDGSIDNTRELVESYSDDRIIYIYKKNGGINSARNMAIQNAKGRYIAFCDSDDIWLPQKLEKHLQKYQEDDEVKAVYDLTGVFEDQNGEKRVVPARNDICEGWCYSDVLKQGFLTSPTFLSCKRECFEKIGMMPTDLTYCEDDEFCFRLSKHFKIGLIKEVLGIYTLDAPDKICSMEKLCADDYIKFLEKWSSEIKRICGNEILSHRYFQAAYKYFEIGDTDSMREIYQKACLLREISLEEIKVMVKRNLIKSDDVIIYGVGEWGRKVYRALKMIGLSNFTFMVTDSTRGPKELYNIQVQQIDTLNSNINRSVIIASSKYYEEMKAIAKEKGFTNIVSYAEIVDLIFNNKG